LLSQSCGRYICDRKKVSQGYLSQNQTLFSIARVRFFTHQNDISSKRTKSLYRPDACLHASTPQLPEKVKFPQPDFMTMAEDILAITGHPGRVLSS
jgi:hypothetical protein